MEKLVKMLWDKSKVDIYFILDALLTESEISEFEKRLEVFSALNSWMTYREASKSVWVSLNTITRGSKEMQNKPRIKDYL